MDELSTLSGARTNEEEEDDEDGVESLTRELGDGASLNVTQDPSPSLDRSNLLNTNKPETEIIRRSRSESSRSQRNEKRSWSTSPVKSRYRRPKGYGEPRPIPDLSERPIFRNSAAASQSLVEKKRKNKFADVIRLPEPYDSITSDEVKRWSKDLQNFGIVGPESHHYDIYQNLEYVNALIFKVSRIGKQGLLDKNSLLRFTCDIAKFQIEEKDARKSAYSLFQFSRKLAVKRDKCPPLEKIKLDLLACSWVPPVFAGDPPKSRPPTAKPMDPEFYQFEDKKLEADYKKLWLKCKDLQNYQDVLSKEQEQRSEASITDQ